MKDVNHGKKSDDIKYVLQKYVELPKIQGRVVQTNTWVISGFPAGINFREGKAGTFFKDENPFIPHYVK